MAWRHMRPKQIGLLALLLWVAAGCYLPVRQIPPDSREFFPDWSGKFTAGETSRTEVLLTMGEPDEVSPDETKLTYRWSTVEGIIVVTQCTPPVEISSETTVRFEFDEYGVLRSIDVTA
jgi:hypothetical protein